MQGKRFTLLVCLSAVMLATGCLSQSSPLRTEARRTWKEKSLGEISARLSQPEWTTNEIARLNAIQSDFEEDRWISNELILLQNGEWLLYRNVCRKEPAKIHDLFLAKASDGQWYYSTYHFCRNMVSLKMEFQPPDLTSFTEQFSLQSFDGRSDECLEQTWPPPSR